MERQDKNGSRCLARWDGVNEGLTDCESEASQEPKLIFSIKKRQNTSSKLLLDKSQPSWIHRMFLQSLLVLGNN